MNDETTETPGTAEAAAEAAPAEAQERSHEESAPRHEPAACACRQCAPGRFSGPEKLAQPVHQCQRCFIGVCEAEDGAEPRTDGGWLQPQADRPDLFRRPQEEAE